MSKKDKMAAHKLESEETWPHRNFDKIPHNDILLLVQNNPLAWIVSHENGALVSTPVPLRAEIDETGGITRFRGHFARGNPQIEVLTASPQALVLFMGAQGYASPSWLSDRTQAPTWLYESAQFSVEFEFLNNREALSSELESMVTQMEEGRRKPWRIEEMGPRYDRLSQGIVAFSARVDEARIKFKLGQDERDDVCEELIDGLEHSGMEDLARSVCRYNRRK